jgi:putative ABC transport system substrate-binding protein
MHRRRFLVTSLAGAVVPPLVAVAQPAGKVWRIGFLSPQTPTDLEVSRLLGGFLGSAARPRVRRGSEHRTEWLPAFALELVRLNVDVIVATTGPAALAAKNATTTIPIVTVLGTGSWPVGSLARPSENVTGLTSISVELGPKLLELLREAVPKASRVAVLSNPNTHGAALQLRELEVAARVLGVQLQLLEARGSEQFDSAFAAMARERADALLVLADPLFWSHRTRIADLAAKSRRPAIYGRREHVEAGGLMAYAPSVAELLRRAATYVAKILKGAKPADLPIEQPTKFELVINMKTAKALGLTVPPSLLLRADQVLE